MMHIILRGVIATIAPGVSTVLPGQSWPRRGLVCEKQSTTIHGLRAHGQFWSQPGQGWVGSVKVMMECDGTRKSCVLLSCLREKG